MKLIFTPFAILSILCAGTFAANVKRDYYTSPQYTPINSIPPSHPFGFYGQRLHLNPEANAPILRQVDQRSSDGSYNYEYETGNGIRAHETSVQNGPERIVRGSYSYIGPDGKTYTVNYIADRNGYRAYGAHLPTQPHEVAPIVENAEAQRYASKHIYNNGGIGVSPTAFIHSTVAPISSYPSSTVAPIFHDSVNPSFGGDFINPTTIRPTIIHGGEDSSTLSPFGFSSTVAPPLSSISSTPRPDFISSSTPFGAISSTVQPPFGAISSTVQPPFGAISSTIQPPFGAISSTGQPPFGTISSTGQPPFGAISSTGHPPFSAISSTGSPFGYASIDTQFNGPIGGYPTIQSPIASRFGDARPTIGGLPPNGGYYGAAASSDFGPFSVNPIESYSPFSTAQSSFENNPFSTRTTQFDTGYETPASGVRFRVRQPYSTVTASPLAYPAGVTPINQHDTVYITPPSQATRNQIYENGFDRSYQNGFNSVDQSVRPLTSNRYDSTTNRYVKK